MWDWVLEWWAKRQSRQRIKAEIRNYEEGLPIFERAMVIMPEQKENAEAQIIRMKAKIQELQELLSQI